MEGKPAVARWTNLLILAGISTTIGSSLTVGYNIGVVNSPAQLIKTFCNASVYTRYDVILSESQLDVLWSAIVSIFLVGGAMGSLTGSWIADKLGRKGTIIVNTILATISAILFVIAKPANSVELLVIARFVVGLSSGLATCVVPMYLMELAPLKLKGAMGVLCPLGVTFGVLVGQVMSLSSVLGREDTWQYLLGFYLIFVVISSLALPILPESPKYLYVIKNKTQQALLQLSRIRNVSEGHLNADIIELQIEQRNDQEESRNWNLITVLTNRSFLLPILLVCSMQAGQQFVGINAVFYYSVSIFERAGLSTQDSEYATIGAGVINLAMAIISIPVMSRFNRRTIFQISSASAAVCLLTLGTAVTYIRTISWMPYLCIIGVLGFVLCYGIGLGPIPYFIGSELFEVGPRPSAMALGSMANWAGNFLIGMTFPTMQVYFGPASFYIFAFIAILLFIFIRTYLPETRGCDPRIIAENCKHGLSIRPVISPQNSGSTNTTSDTK